MGARAPYLTDKEYKFVMEILDGSTIAQASDAVGINLRTGQTWRHKENIKQAIEAGRNGGSKVIEEVRAGRLRAIVPAIAAKIDEHVLEAVDVLVELMRTGERGDSVRFSAAKEILRLSGAFMEQTMTTTSKGNETTTKSRGLSNEQAADIRRQILGVGKKVEVNIVNMSNSGTGVDAELELVNVGDDSDESRYSNGQTIDIDGQTVDIKVEGE